MNDTDSSNFTTDTATFGTFQEYLNAFYKDAKCRWQNVNGFFLTGVKDFQQIENQIRWKNYRLLKWADLPIESGFILVPNSRIPEMWIDRDISSTDYKRLYQDFLRNIIQIKDVETALIGYDLDHVYSFSSAHRKELVRYMLLLPVDDSVNRSYSSLEHARSGDERGQKLVHSGDYFTFAKAMGIKAPSIAESAKEDELENYITQLVLFGCVHDSSREIDLNAFRILYNRVKDASVKSRKTAKNSPLPSRGRRNLSSGKLKE